MNPCLKTDKILTLTVGEMRKRLKSCNDAGFQPLVLCTGDTYYLSWICFRMDLIFDFLMIWVSVRKPSRLCRSSVRSVLV